MRSRLIKALNNRFYVKFMQLEIGLFAVFCQVFLESLAIIEIGIINYLCIPNLSVIFYFVTS